MHRRHQGINSGRDGGARFPDGSADAPPHSMTGGLGGGSAAALNQHTDAMSGVPDADGVPDPTDGAIARHRQRLVALEAKLQVCGCLASEQARGQLPRAPVAMPPRHHTPRPPAWRAWSRFACAAMRSVDSQLHGATRRRPALVATRAPCEGAGPGPAGARLRAAMSARLLTLGAGAHGSGGPTRQGAYRGHSLRTAAGGAECSAARAWREQAAAPAPRCPQRSTACSLVSDPARPPAAWHGQRRTLQGHAQQRQAQGSPIRPLGRHPHP